MNNIKNEIKLEPEHLTIRTRMPDGSLWDINGESLMRQMIWVMTGNDLKPMQMGLKNIHDVRQDLINEFNQGPEKALSRWSSSLEWSQVKPIAKKLNNEEPDHTLGWKFGSKEIFKL